MGAAKKLHAEYCRSGWLLSGFRVEERKAWRRLFDQATKDRNSTRAEVKAEGQRGLLDEPSA